MKNSRDAKVFIAIEVQKSDLTPKTGIGGRKSDLSLQGEKISLGRECRVGIRVVLGFHPQESEAVSNLSD
jgi:hypothetical protein